MLSSHETTPKTRQYWIKTLREWAESRLAPPQNDECQQVLDELASFIEPPPVLKVHIDRAEFERVLAEARQAQQDARAARAEAIWNAQAHAQVQAADLDWKVQYETMKARCDALRDQVARDHALRAEMQQTADLLLSPEHIKERVCNPAIAATLLELLRHYEFMEKQ